MALKILDLTGNTKLNPNDGAKRGFLLKTSESKKATQGKHKGDNAVIALLPPKGPKKENWKNPHRFKSVELYSATGEFICKLTPPAKGRSQWYDEDGSHRQIWQMPFAPADLPKTPCVLVADDWYWELKNVQKRID